MNKLPLYEYVLDDRFISLMAFILIFAMAARTPLDSDMWWHLRAGEATWQQGKPLVMDLFSSTRYGEAWINHSWLSQVGMYWLFRAGGYFALGFGVATIALLSMVFVYLQMAGSAVLKAFILIFASMVASMVWSPRPQLVSLLLFGILSYVLYLYKWKQRDHLWALPILFLLWSNLHGGYVLGLLLIGALIGGEIFNRSFGYAGEGRISNKGLWRLILLTGLSGLVVAINPNGPAMWMIPFRTVGVGVLQEFISEWASPDFHAVAQQSLLWLLMITIIALALSKLPVDGYELIAFCGFAYLAFLARRNYGPFAMVAAPLLSKHLHHVLTAWWRRMQPNISPYYEGKLFKKFKTRGNVAPPLRARVTINSLLLLVFATGGVVKLAVVTSPALVSEYLQVFFPVQAVEWIQQNQPPGAIFNEYNWGGYLTWHLRGYPVFVDGRTDMYHDELLRSYLEIRAGEGDWDELLQENTINLVLIEKQTPLGQALLGHPDWTRVYQDRLADVFERLIPIQSSRSGSPEENF